ncbi:hypothetical protein WOLCODRAFT_141892 [Wolfiporia cocos MD-104 SS10]|uniref:Fucose-specific lectin n=1 Tax=Wolfiporia cocos (strain MD-104) TaxID=742152 RepID=A0A2H3JBB8_WOLCO|nr:hypothetical protein WOLCODRAFT_141892 [Wolfiporia cocos MD-104 SS10]
MSHLQDVTRFLLAAGGAAHPQDKGMYLLYTNHAILTIKHWTGTVVGDQELITKSVRADSTASYVLKSDGTHLIFCISLSSTIRALRLAEEEEGWVNHEIPPFDVHSMGSLAATIDRGGRRSVLFQDASGKLVHLDDTWTPSVLPVDAVIGSPIATLQYGDNVRAFYISAADNCMHDVTRCRKVGWRDRRTNSYIFSKMPKRLTVGRRGSGSFETFALTADDMLLLILDNGQSHVLGKVDGMGVLWAGDGPMCCRELPQLDFRPTKWNNSARATSSSKVEFPRMRRMTG